MPLILILGLVCLTLVIGCRASDKALVKPADKAAGETQINKKDSSPKNSAAEKSNESEAGNSSKSGAQIHEQSKKDTPSTETRSSKPASGEQDISARSKGTKSHEEARGGSAKSDKKLSEPELIKRASLEIAKGIETVKKIRICHAKNQDEWWVTIYDDLGPVIDVKQYVWDRDTETLKPFLVLKRISKNKLEAELSSKVPDRTCENIDPPVKSPEKN